MECSNKQTNYIGYLRGWARSGVPHVPGNPFIFRIEAGVDNKHITQLKQAIAPNDSSCGLHFVAPLIVILSSASVFDIDQFWGSELGGRLFAFTKPQSLIYV